MLISRLRVLVPLLLLAAGLAARAQDVELRLSDSVGQHGRQEITFTLPDDPAQAAIEGVFTAPSGRRSFVPGFFWQEYDPLGNRPGAGRAWKIRFAPVEPGIYGVSVRVSRQGAEPHPVAQAAFECVRSVQPGFVRRDQRHLVLSTGEEFFPIGANRPWGDLRQPQAYFEDMERLAQAGANCVRVWLAPWWMPIEQRPGRYDPSASALMDLILEKAEALGLRVILVIEQHGNFEPEGGEVGRWNTHPYNAANGGPCQTASEFFSGGEARRLFKDRLRYLVARWGYSPAVLSWELFNEVEWVPLNDVWDRRRLFERWHVEMAQYLRRIDPFNHLVATSADVELQNRLLQQGAVDLVQVHLYEKEDIGGKIHDLVAPLANECPAPVLVEEYGLKPDTRNAEAVTRGLFAAAFCGAGCGALPWLQDTADPAPAYQRLRAAQTFLRTVNWRRQEFKPVTPVIVEASNGRMGRMPEQDLAAIRTLAQVGREETHLYVYGVRPMRTGPLERRWQLRVLIPEIPAGPYSLEFWDCATGSVMHRQVVRPAADERAGAYAGLQVDLPWSGQDVVVRMGRLGG